MGSVRGNDTTESSGRNGLQAVSVAPLYHSTRYWP